MKEGVSFTPNTAVLTGAGRGLDISLKSEAEDWGPLSGCPRVSVWVVRDESGKCWEVRAQPACPGEAWPLPTTPHPMTGLFWKACKVLSQLESVSGKLMQTLKVPGC